jgi:parvulin-like peptidyl-prolyl isomerase
MKTCLPLATLLWVTLAATLSAQTPPAAPPSFGAAPPPADKVVATVDGKDITYGEFLSLMSMAPPNLQLNPQLALQNIFMMKYLAAEGDKLKLAEQSPLKEEIELQRMNMVAGAMVNLQRETSTVAPGAAEAYYQANSSKYEQARIKVIFIAFKPTVAGSVSNTDDLARAAQNALAQAHSATDRSEAQARTLAEEVVKKARSGGDFVALVAQYSEDPGSKASQGDWGVIKHDSTSYPDDLKKAVFALAAGQVTEPVRQATGFYIIRVEEKSVQPMQEVAPDIIQSLKMQNLNDWFSALNKRFKPEIKDPAAFVRPGANGGLSISPLAPAAPKQ